MNQVVATRKQALANPPEQNALAAGVQAVLAYEHEGVVLKLMKNHGMTKEKAESVWMDTKKFLYLCGWKDDKSFSMTPTVDIDKGWHEFILFTREYRDFCMTNFGDFIHHDPNVESLRKEILGVTSLSKCAGDTCSGSICSGDTCSGVTKNLITLRQKVSSDCNSNGPNGECGASCSSYCKSAPEPDVDGGNISVKNDIQKTLIIAKKVFGELSENWKFGNVKSLDCSGTTNCQHNCRNCSVPSQ